jgi:hypothetical protein
MPHTLSRIYNLSLLHSTECEVRQLLSTARVSPRRLCNAVPFTGMTCAPALPAQPCQLLAWRHCGTAQLRRTCSRPSAASRQSYGAPNRSRRTSYPTSTSASINSWYIDVSCADAYSLSQTRTLASQYCINFSEHDVTGPCAKCYKDHSSIQATYARATVGVLLA